MGFMKKCLWIIIFSCLNGAVASVFAQTADDKINPDKFDYILFDQIYHRKINEQRLSQNKDELLWSEVLEKAAVDQSATMAKTKKINQEGSSKNKRTTGDRIAFYGGTSLGLEIVQGTNIGKDVKTYFTYNQVVDDLLTKVNKAKKYSDIINNPTAFYIGIGASVDASGKRIFVSIVVGGLETINQGKSLRKVLNLPYSKRDYGITGGNQKECRNCERFDDYNALQQGLSIQQGKIYFEYGNLRRLKKLLANADDGIAIDIIQKAQYPCDTFNIYDAEKMHRGILLKPIYSKELFKSNSSPERENRFEGYIATVPRSILKKLGGEYEINVNIIQKGKFCKRVMRAYMEGNRMSNDRGMSLMPDTINPCLTCNIRDDIEMDSTKNSLVFKIPFDKNKSEYKLKDLQPILDALNEPKYTIEAIDIVAYTSIEGDSIKNTLLQIKRAKSILEALKKFNKSDFVNTIETRDGYELFQHQVLNTERAIYSKMSKKLLLDTINSSLALRKEFEPILQEERVTEVHMKVRYMTEGDNELPFVIHSLEKAIAKESYYKALRIQQYAIRQCMIGKYDPAVLLRIKIPVRFETVPLCMNQLFIESRFYRDDTLTAAMQARLNELVKLDPNNDKLKFNRILAFLNNDYFKDQAMIDEYGNRIETLKKSKLKPEMVNALYMEYLFKIISQFDSSGTGLGNKNVVMAMEKLRKQFSVDKGRSNWENALQMADIFIRHNDYRYAAQLMTPYLRDEGVSEKFVFTYISVIGRYPENWFNPDFRFALSKAKELNSKRYCQLFSDPYLSIQVLEHPLIKREYCETCR